VQLRTIGTGTAAPSPHRVQSATLVTHGELRLLVDCGSGAVYRMAQLGIDWTSITHLALTHFHADHTNDVANLLYAWRYGMLPPRTTPIEIIGPAGTQALLERMALAFGSSLSTAVPMVVHELAPGDKLQLAAGSEIEAAKVPHTAESVAYSISAGGTRAVLSGDTGFDPAFAAWAAGCEVLVLECSLPDALAIPTHLTPRQCGEVAALARPSLLALTHFYPPVEDVDIEGQVAERFDGRVLRAHDGWMIDLQEMQCSS
jgi:ribonuclease BN (tRNA processing enzyme)